MGRPRCTLHRPGYMDLVSLSLYKPTHSQHIYHVFPCYMRYCYDILLDQARENEKPPSE